MFLFSYHFQTSAFDGFSLPLRKPHFSLPIPFVPQALFFSKIILLEYRIFKSNRYICVRFNNEGTIREDTPVIHKNCKVSGG